MILGAAASEAFFTTITRKIKVDKQKGETLPPVAHAGFVSIIAMLLCVLPVLKEQPWRAIAKLPVSGWLALLWYGCIVTIAAFTCMFAGAKRCSGYTIAACSALIPISSVVLSVVFLKVSISLVQAAGCILIVLATVVIGIER